MENFTWKDERDQMLGTFGASWVNLNAKRTPVTVSMCKGGTLITVQISRTDIPYKHRHYQNAKLNNIAQLPTCFYESVL